MIYSVLTKKIGIPAKLLYDIDIDEEVVDFAYSNCPVILTKTNIIHIDNGEQHFKFEHMFYDACSFSYASRNFFVVEKGGKNIYMLSDDTMDCRLFIAGTNKAKLEGYLKKIPDDSDAVVVGVDMDTAYLLIPDANRIFSQCDSVLRVLAGSGYAGYSSSSNILSCRFNSPQGLCVRGNDILIADTGNGMIRGVGKNGIYTVAGHPLQNRIHAGKITLCRNMLCFIGKDGVSAINLDEQKDKKVYDFHKSDNKLFISSDGQALYILEKHGK